MYVCFKKKFILLSVSALIEMIDFTNDSEDYNGTQDPMLMNGLPIPGDSHLCSVDIDWP